MLNFLKSFSNQRSVSKQNSFNRKNVSLLLMISEDNYQHLRKKSIQQEDLSLNYLSDSKAFRKKRINLKQITFSFLLSIIECRREEDHQKKESILRAMRTIIKEHSTEITQLTLHLWNLEKIILTKLNKDLVVKLRIKIAISVMRYLVSLWIIKKIKVKGWVVVKIFLISVVSQHWMRNLRQRNHSWENIKRN